MRWPSSATGPSLSALMALTQGVPVGTNLALLHLLRMLVSGALLGQRGALFRALKALGLSDAAARRAWWAFRRGAWGMPDLVRVWRAHIEHFSDWQVHTQEG